MKFFTVFAAIVAVALASPAEWTLHDLSTAIQDPSTPDALRPVLEQALSELMQEMMSGSTQTTITVSTPVQDFSAWTLYELSEAIMDPATDPALVVYLEHALNNMMMDLMSGGQPEYVIVATPVGLLPVEAVVVPAPAPVDAVVVPPTPVESVPSSPLVQIIVNVNSQELSPAPVDSGVVPQPPVNPVDVIAVNPIVVPEPVVLPPPVNPIVIPEPVVLPPPVNPIVIPEPVVLPAPVNPIVVPEPVVLPAPVNPIVVPEPVVLPQPVTPEVVVNPVDIIAINPEIAVNPVDLIHPIPVVAPGNVVGPIV